jgi:hypothetical protein
MSDESTNPPAAIDEPDTVARREVTIRRAPRLLPFLLTGAAGGVVLAAIIAATTAASEGVTQLQAFGYLAVVGIVLGGALAALTMIIVDAVLGRRTSPAIAERTEAAED